MRLVKIIEIVENAQERQTKVETLAAWAADRGLSVGGAETQTSADPLAAIRTPESMPPPDGTAILVLRNFQWFLISAELVGQTEERTRQALRITDAMAPCVAVIDQLEKDLSGVGGVATRLFGTLLT